MQKSKAIHELKTIIEEHVPDDTTEEKHTLADIASPTEIQDGGVPTQVQSDAESRDVMGARERLELAIAGTSRDYVEKQRSEAMLDTIEICNEKEHSKQPIQAKRGATVLPGVTSQPPAPTPDVQPTTSPALTEKSTAFSARKPVVENIEREIEDTCDVTSATDIKGDVRPQTYHELCEAVYMTNVKKCKKKKRRELQNIKKHATFVVDDDEKKKVLSSSKESFMVEHVGDKNVLKNLGFDGELPSTSGVWASKVRGVLRKVKRKRKGSNIQAYPSKHEMKEKTKAQHPNKQACPEDDDDEEPTSEPPKPGSSGKGGSGGRGGSGGTGLPKPKEVDCGGGVKPSPLVTIEKKWEDSEIDYMKNQCSKLTGQLKVVSCKDQDNLKLQPAETIRPPPQRSGRSYDAASQADSDVDDTGAWSDVTCECAADNKDRKKKMKEEAKNRKKKKKPKKEKKPRKPEKPQVATEHEADTEPTDQEQKGKKRKKKQKGKKGKGKKSDEPAQKLSDKQMDTNEQLYDDVGETDDIYTGLFEDGSRRVDLVVVVSESERHSRIKFDLLMGLVQMGIQLEFEAGELPSSPMFVKLHAPDDVLDKYAGMLEARRYFRQHHENIMDDKLTLWGRCFKLKSEREWLKSVRSRHVPPLRFSNHERGYIVYMMLRHQSAVLGYQLERLMVLGVLSDVFMLHDGPYYCPEQKNFKVYNCRQVLFLYWAGARNMFKYQPLHMIHEYFGSKIAFYFVFYGFYNKALLVAALWGVFMTAVYVIKDIDYFRPIREFGCNAEVPFRERKWIDYNTSWSTHRLTLLDEKHIQGNFLCEGESKPTVCHMTLLEDVCLQLYLRMITDSPYVVLYSIGLATWALLFLLFWKRTESYWAWMWEECLFPKHQVFRTVGQLKQCKHLFPRRNPRCNVLNACIFLCALLLLLVVLVVAFVLVHVEWLRPLAVTLNKLTKDEARQPVEQVLVAPEVNEPLELAILAAVVVAVLLILFALEKMFHSLIYMTTSQFESHLTYEAFEKSLVSKYFSYSFLYTSSLVVYFTWLKGTFYNGILDIWDATLNITSPWATHLLATKNISKQATRVLRRALTMNCGQFSCFHEGVIVFVLTMLFRDFVVRIVQMMRRNKKPRLHGSMSTCEREHRLRPTTERGLVDHYNMLFVQLSLVTLFAPVFPLAPLLALLINVFDMRSQARSFVVSRRRAPLFRARGVGHWRHLLKVICYAAPLFHGLSIARTEIFKNYIYYLYEDEFYKQYKYSWLGFLTGMLYADIDRTEAMMHHEGFYETYQQRVSSPHNDSFVIRGMEEHREVGLFHYFFANCARVDGFYESMSGRTQDEWPLQWGFLGENYSFNTPRPAHYHMKFLKIAFVLAYVVVFAAVSACVWGMVRGCPGGVSRRAQRERVLRRLHQHRLTHLRQAGGGAGGRGGKDSQA